MISILFSSRFFQMKVPGGTPYNPLSPNVSSSLCFDNKKIRIQKCSADRFQEKNLTAEVA